MGSPRATIPVHARLPDGREVHVLFHENEEFTREEEGPTPDSEPVFTTYRARGFEVTIHLPNDDTFETAWGIEPMRTGRAGLKDALAKWAEIVRRECPTIVATLNPK